MRTDGGGRNNIYKDLGVETRGMGRGPEGSEARVGAIMGKKAWMVKKSIF
jgi:hypothetical protein